MEIQTRMAAKKFKKTIITLVFVLGISMWGLMVFYNKYNNPTLIGEWISEETGHSVEFMSNGQVYVDDIETGSYIITDQDEMEYNVENQLFNMEYNLENRNLTWNIIGENSEKFKRKW